DLHCAPTVTAADNLRAEGVEASRIAVTGNTVVEATAESLPPPAEVPAIWKAFGVAPGRFVLATVHRPENVDDVNALERVIAALADLGLPVLLPVHPRTKESIARFGLGERAGGLRCVEPVDHPTFLALATGARMLVSDSGGIQEECTVIKKPLVVVRNSTERPESVAAGFARLVRPGDDLANAMSEMLSDEALARRLPTLPSPYGDGHASERIVELVTALVGG
ncbi:MAG: UDP-N-acetyl glucosamine 2-epimerase, partial [Acidimicrobiales bacterium]